MALPCPPARRLASGGVFCRLPDGRGMRDIERRSLKHLLFASLPFVLWLGFAIAACPEVQEPRWTPDSHGYTDWPEDWLLGHGYRVMGARPMVFPLILKGIGAGPPLVQFQFLFSLICWCFLGWCMARSPGVVVGGLFASCLAVWHWNHHILSESVSISFMALWLAFSLRIANRWSWPAFALWILAGCGCAWSRDINLALVPIMAFPVFWVPRRRALVLLAALVCIFTIGSISSARNKRSQFNISNVITERVLTDPDALEEFRAQGMPTSAAVLQRAGTSGLGSRHDLLREAPEFFTWLDERGQKAYLRWVLFRVASYSEAYQQLARQLDIVPFHGPRRPSPERPLLVFLASRLYALPVPMLVWLAALLVPLLELGLRKRVGPLSLLAALLVPASFVQAFLGYHADTMGLNRHMLGAVILARLAVVAGVIALLRLAISSDWLRRRLRWQAADSRGPVAP